MVDGNDCTGEWQKTGDSDKGWEDREPFQIGTVNLKFEKYEASKGFTGGFFGCVAGKGVTGVFRLREKLVGCREAYRKRHANHTAIASRKLLGVKENFLPSAS
jgi:hypothetical protein